MGDAKKLPAFVSISWQRRKGGTLRYVHNSFPVPPPADVIDLSTSLLICVGRQTRGCHRAGGSHFYSFVFAAFQPPRPGNNR